MNYWKVKALYFKKLIVQTLIKGNKLESKEVSNQSRDKILLFEEMMKSFPGAKLGDMEECPLKHTFSNGMYVREIFIPKGTLIVGKIHRHSHPNFLMQGKVKVVTEGMGTEILEAPLSMISKKRSTQSSLTLQRRNLKTPSSFPLYINQKEKNGLVSSS